MPLTDQQILTKYKELPDDLRKATFSVATSNAILKIAQKYSLNVEEDGLLAREIGLVLLGVNRARDLPGSLEKNLHVSQEKAWEIARDINHMIFFEIRENLKKVQGIPETEALLPEEGRASLPPGQSAPSPAVTSLGDKTYWAAVKEARAPVLTASPAPVPGKSDASNSPKITPTGETKIPVRVTPRAVPEPIKVASEPVTMEIKTEPPKPAPETEKIPLVIQPEPMEAPNLPGLSDILKKPELLTPKISLASPAEIKREEPVVPKAPPTVLPQAASVPAPKPIPMAQNGEKPVLAPAKGNSGHDPYREPIDEE